MTNKLTLTEQEELFAKDCKLINLKYEYNGYTGDERWAIITELSVKELWEKYPLVIERYSPCAMERCTNGEYLSITRGYFSQSSFTDNSVIIAHLSSPV